MTYTAQPYHWTTRFATADLEQMLEKDPDNPTNGVVAEELSKRYCGASAQA